MADERTKEKPPRRLGRRTVLRAGAMGGAATVLAMLNEVAWSPMRPAMAATPLPAIQCDLSSFIAPATSVDGVMVQFGPVYTVFQMIDLKRRPTLAEQTAFEDPLPTIDAAYPSRPPG